MNRRDYRAYVHWSESIRTQHHPRHAVRHHVRPCLLRRFLAAFGS